MTHLQQYYTENDGLITLCHHCAEERTNCGEWLQWAATLPEWELADPIICSCYDCNALDDKARKDQNQ